MSKFAAIEARVTRYPASTNDVVWLVERIRALREALIDLEAIDYRWAIHHPWLMEPYHDAARAALAALDEPNLPDA